MRRDHGRAAAAGASAKRPGMRKAVIKAVSYKTLTTVELAVLAWLVTGSWSLAGTFGLLHATVTGVTYAMFDAAFEGMWAKREARGV